MPKRLNFPRNEASRRDRIAGREIYNAATRNIKSRNDALAQSRYPTIGGDIVLSGTAISGGVTEEMMVNGSETLILTLSGDTWHADIGANNEITDALIAGFSTLEAEAAGFIAQIIGGDGALDNTDIVRTSATVVTITFPASASFSIAASEVVNIDVPGLCTAKGIDPTSDSFTVTGNVSIALTGTAIAGGVLESEIVTGSETVIITLTGDTWAATIAADNAITTAFLAAILGDLADAAGWNAQMALVHGDLARTSATILTLTLPATAGYSITTGNETVTVPVQSDAVAGGIVPVSKTFVITEGS